MQEADEEDKDEDEETGWTSPITLSFKHLFAFSDLIDFSFLVSLVLQALGQCLYHDESTMCGGKLEAPVHPDILGLVLLAHVLHSSNVSQTSERWLGLASLCSAFLAWETMTVKTRAMFFRTVLILFTLPG